MFTGKSENQLSAGGHHVEQNGEVSFLAIRCTDGGPEGFVIFGPDHARFVARFAGKAAVTDGPRNGDLRKTPCTIDYELSINFFCQSWEVWK